MDCSEENIEFRRRNPEKFLLLFSTLGLDQPVEGGIAL